MTRIRTVSAASAAVLLMVALAACAPDKTPLPLPGDATSAAPVESPTPSPSVSPLRMDEADALLLQNVTLTLKVAGGTWTNADQVVSDCTTADGQPGGQFTQRANAGGDNDWNTVLASVGQLWDSLGFTSEVVATTDGAHDRKTTTPDGQVLHISVGGGGAMTFDGVSTCALSSASG